MNNSQDEKDETVYQSNVDKNLFVQKAQYEHVMPGLLKPNEQQALFLNSLFTL